MQKLIATRLAKRNRSEYEQPNNTLIDTMVIQSAHNDVVISNESIVVLDTAVYTSLYTKLYGEKFNNTTHISKLQKFKTDIIYYTEHTYNKFDCYHATCNVNLRQIKLDDVNMIDNINHNKTLVVYPSIYEDMFIMTTRYNLHMIIKHKTIDDDSNHYMNDTLYTIPSLYSKNYYHIACLLVKYSNFMRHNFVTDISLYYYVFVNIIKQFMFVGLDRDLVQNLLLDTSNLCNSRVTDEFKKIVSFVEFYKILHNIIIITKTYNDKTYGVQQLINNIMLNDTRVSVVYAIKQEYITRIVRSKLL
jgi:hypothetical protein